MHEAIACVATRAYERDDHYPICSKLHCGSLLTLCGLYYARSYTVAIFPGPIYSFAVLYTENLAFQCVSYTAKLAGNI